MMSTLLALALAVAPAEAAETAAILRIEGPVVYTALGRGDGVRPGQTVSLYRTVSALDPTTGRTLVDHFTVGSGTVLAAGDTLTQVRVSASVAVQLQPGDQVRLLQPESTEAAASPVVSQPAPVRSAPSAPVAVRDEDRPLATAPEVRTEVRYELSAEAKAFQGAFAETGKEDRDGRVETWTAFLRRHPDSPMADAVRAELASLRRGPARPGATEDRGAIALDATPSAPAAVAERTAPRVVLSTQEMDRLASATLFYRLRGEESFRYRAMRPIGDTAVAATIPEEAVLAPGVEWFIEARTEDGTVLVGGNPMKPSAMRVEERVAPIEVRDRSEVMLLAEYVDFFVGSGADRYFHAETDFLYRINKGPLYSMRMGAGSFRGQGGEVDALDEAFARGGAQAAQAVSQQVGYNFGYTELEFKLAPAFSVMGRGVLGVDNDGLAPGGEARIRVGREEGTSLDAGAARVGNIGVRYLLRLSWNAVEKVPMAASVEMTDFPGVARIDGRTVDDYGVRLIYEARYAITEHFDLGGRVGWQLRNINHAGPSGGIQTVFSW